MGKQEIEKYLSKQAQKHIAEYRKHEQVIRRDWGGPNRLKRLCSPDMRERFEKAEKMVQKAIDSGTAESIKGMVAMMERAFFALVTEVNERGYVYIQPNVRYYEFGSKNYLVVDHDHELENALERHGQEPNTILISMEQLFKFLPEEMADILKAVQELSPTAKFKSVEHK